MSQSNRTSEIPPHMLENPISNAQKKAFATVKRASTKKETPPAKKPAPRKAAKKAGAKKASRKKTSATLAAADSGYTLGAEKSEKP